MGVGGERARGSCPITIAPFSFPANLAKSWGPFASKYTTGPRTVPLVFGDQAAEAIVSGCSVGASTRAFAVPRTHACGIVYASRWTFVRPYFLNISTVQSLACFKRADPVSRGPIR